MFSIEVLLVDLCRVATTRQVREAAECAARYTLHPARTVRPVHADSLSYMLNTDKQEFSVLPNLRHLSRVPSHISTEQVARIRKAAFNLPQVVTPGDFLSTKAPRLEDYLDEEGYILLQRPVAGARASRWIDPALLDSALEHLEGMGSNARAKALLTERQEALEQLGVRRKGAQWERVCRSRVDLGHPGLSLLVAHAQPVAADAVWELFRTGTPTALTRVLQEQPAYPHAAEVAEYLTALVARASALSATHLPSLLPALQAECAKSAELPELKAACDRAFIRWAHRVAEREALDELTSELTFAGYPDTFSKARRMRRRVTLFVGPPNSGKTHHAFERLARASSGAYLAPLRLLALEGRDRLAARGVPCSLLTGEESVTAPGARIVSSTIEMVGTGESVDVAVIDEAQMLFDRSRGWAWTQAIVGVPAQELFIICSAFAVPAIRSLLGVCGESCDVVTFERKQQVQLLPGAVPLKNVRKGDAVVAFSRKDVLVLRDQLARDGKKVSVIYGALPPEVRRREADAFAQGESDVLVATDAIGMGLNLPIRRVLFSTLEKFDGTADRELTESEVHHEEGFVGVLAEAHPKSLRTLSRLLARSPQAPGEFRARVAPNWWHIDTISTRLQQTSRLREVLAVFMDQLKLDSSHFEVAELEQMLELAGQLDQCAVGLGLRERFVYAQAPVDTRTPTALEQYLQWASRHASQGTAGAPAFLTTATVSGRLDDMEHALRLCTLWLWLSLRFEGVYGHVQAVTALRARLNDEIEQQLKSKKALWVTRRWR
jgi:ATP-dependent RNA helicase SUPV3L1/SUV3